MLADVAGTRILKDREWAAIISRQRGRENICVSFDDLLLSPITQRIHRPTPSGQRFNPTPKSQINHILPNTPLYNSSRHALPSPGMTSLTAILRCTTTGGTMLNARNRPLCMSHATACSLARE